MHGARRWLDRPARPPAVRCPLCGNADPGLFVVRARQWVQLDTRRPVDDDLPTIDPRDLAECRGQIPDPHDGAVECGYRSSVNLLMIEANRPTDPHAAD